MSIPGKGIRKGDRAKNSASTATPATIEIDLVKWPKMDARIELRIRGNKV